LTRCTEQHWIFTPKGHNSYFYVYPKVHVIFRTLRKFRCRKDYSYIAIVISIKVRYRQNSTHFVLRCTAKLIWNKLDQACTATKIKIDSLLNVHMTTLIVKWEMNLAVFCIKTKTTIDHVTRLKQSLNKYSIVKDTTKAFKPRPLITDNKNEIVKIRAKENFF